MRKIAKIAAICAVFGLALFAVGCSNSSDPLPYVPGGGGGGKKAGSISYATTSVGKNIGDEAFTNPLTKTGDGVVVYGSSDANVATVDTATGEVTIKAVGTTTIKATVSDSEAYTYETKSASYTLEVKNPVTIPLTLEFTAAGKITFINKPATLKYSFDGGETKTDASEDSITVSAGGKVSLFAETTGSTEPKPFKISCDADCYVYGNVMSLVTLTSSGEWNPNARELASAYVFYMLFYVTGNKIKNHPSNNLVLPATTLTQSCYSWMFYGCTGLTRAPALPATTLVRFCYNSMFQKCTGLTSAPDLPATTLANNCYSDMFSGCTGLKSAPALPATTLEVNCYSAMFEGCASLTKAPDLPATTLAELCYRQMFSGCAALKEIKCLATDISASDCTTDWVKDVPTGTPPGTFTCDSTMVATWEAKIGNVSGVPTGWTVTAQ